MTDPLAAGEPRSEAAPLIRVLRAVTAPLLVSALAMTLLGFWLPAPLVLFLTALVYAYCALHFLSLRAASAGRAEAALALHATSLWLIAIGVSLGGARLLTLGAILVLLPVVAAVPYVSNTRLLWLGGMAGLVMAGAAGLVAMGVSLAFVPEEAARPFLAVAVVATSSVCCLALWHSCSTLAASASAAEQANARLRASEALLERKVEERSAELERSRTALARARDEALASNRHKSAFLASESTTD